MNEIEPYGRLQGSIPFAKHDLATDTRYRRLFEHVRRCLVTDDAGSSEFKLLIRLLTSHHDNEHQGRAVELFQTSGGPMGVVFSQCVQVCKELSPSFRGRRRFSNLVTRWSSSSFGQVLASSFQL